MGMTEPLPPALLSKKLGLGSCVGVEQRGVLGGRGSIRKGSMVSRLGVSPYSCLHAQPVLD